MRWRDSLFVRVVVLCGVLIACLLGSVAVLSRYYVNEAIQEMESHAEEIVESIYAMLEENPGMDNDTLAAGIMELYEEDDVNIQPLTGEMATSGFRLERHQDGEVTRVGVVPLDLGARQVILTLRATTRTQVEILRAFTNRYMIALLGAFVLALGLMIYMIAKALRPLTELSKTCSAITGGAFQPVSTQGASGEILALEETFNTMVEALREKELVEAKLRQAQRLSALGNLAAGVAHDVRNPLNAIKLLSSHALDNLDGGPDARAAIPLQTIRKEVDRLEDIVSSFLSLAKESALAPEPQRVDGLLEECVRLIQKDAEERGIRLSSDLRAGDKLLSLDGKQMTRAILNVLLNALEACPRGGRVSLLSRLTDRACQIEIRDDGPGLSREAAEHVFDPYYTTKRGGTGLGLSITRGIVEEHGGAIELYSVEAQGCQVLITLPLEQSRTP